MRTVVVVVEEAEDEVTRKAEVDILIANEEETE